MQIKTIFVRAKRDDLVPYFDEQVNTAIADGWKLAKRELHTYEDKTVADLLYAELVKDDKPEPSGGIPWQQAMLAVRQMCDNNFHCAACPAYAVCGPGAPYAWKMGAMKEAET